MATLEDFQRVLPPSHRLVRFLKQGGQGAVFEGLLNSHKVAIKFFSVQDDLRRITRESEALRQLNCPHVVRAVDSLTVQFGGIETPVVVYEFLAGGDLTPFVTPTGQLMPIRELLRLASQMSLALQVIWNHRLVHRDIKPANIVLDGSRYVIVDFAFARHVDRSNVTAMGLSPGTPGYKSPEQALGRRNLTIKSDVYSLGVTLYELACRRHPFNYNQSLMGQIGPPPLRQERNELPESFCRCVHEMMATLPFERPAPNPDRFDTILKEIECSL